MFITSASLWKHIDIRDASMSLLGRIHTGIQKHTYLLLTKILKMFRILSICIQGWTSAYMTAKFFDLKVQYGISKDA
jgi:hypothetical protein